VLLEAVPPDSRFHARVPVTPVLQGDDVAVMVPPLSKSAVTVLTALAQQLSITSSIVGQQAPLR
jgi:hypothetical protein